MPSFLFWFIFIYSYQDYKFQVGKAMSSLIKMFPCGTLFLVGKSSGFIHRFLGQRRQQSLVSYPVVLSLLSLS